MHCQPLLENDLDKAFAIGGAEDYNYTEYLELYQKYADLYVGSYHAGKLVGVCYGWPFYQVRSDQPEMMLNIIAITPAYQRQGYGTQLIRYWEQQVAKRGHWLISLGSGADMFYVKMDYFTIEYAIKVDKALLNPNFRNMGYAISYVRYREDPTLVLYVQADEGKYEPELKQALMETFAAHDVVTIFGKYV